MNMSFVTRLLLRLRLVTQLQVSHNAVQFHVYLSDPIAQRPVSRPNRCARIGQRGARSPKRQLGRGRHSLMNALCCIVDCHGHASLPSDRGSGGRTLQSPPGRLAPSVDGIPSCQICVVQDGQCVCPACGVWSGVGALSRADKVSKTSFSTARQYCPCLAMPWEGIVARPVVSMARFRPGKECP